MKRSLESVSNLAALFMQTKSNSRSEKKTGSFINFLRTSSMNHHTYRGRIKLLPNFDSNDVKLLIYSFVNKVNILFKPCF